MANLLNVACQDPRALCIVVCLPRLQCTICCRWAVVDFTYILLAQLTCDGLVTYSVNMLISCRLVDIGGNQIEDAPALAATCVKDD
jgi:hypothetical protein